MKRKKRLKKPLRLLLATALAPIVLFLLAAIAIYIPPVQNYIVGKVAQHLSRTTGMHISVGYVRLAFPLDLGVHRVVAIDGRDTVAALGALRLDVRLMPLLKGRADIDGFSIYDLQLNTKDFVADTYVRGRIGKLEVQAHGVEWNRANVRIDNARLCDARLYIALSDTAAKDTTASTPWHIVADRVRLERTAVCISLPGDSLRLAADIGRADLTGGDFDTGSAACAVRTFDLRGAGIVYALHTSRTPTHASGTRGNPAYRNDDGPLWPDCRPEGEGFDPNYIVLSDIGLKADSIGYTAEGVLRANIRRVSLHERCGMAVSELSGSVYMDSVRLSLPALNLRTAHSRVDAAVAVDWRALQEGRDGRLTVSLDASVAPQDVRTLCRGTVAPELLAAWPQRALNVRAEAGGNMDFLQLKRLEAAMPGAFRLTGSATARHALRDDRDLEARFDLDMPDMTFVKAFLSPDLRNGFDLPRGLHLRGTAGARGEQYRADVRLTARQGSLTARAETDLRRESYAMTARASGFPIGAFLPQTGMGVFSGELTAKGCGFDVPDAGTRLEAKAAVADFTYGTWNLGGMRLEAALADGKASARFDAKNDLIEGEGRIEATLNDDIRARLTANLPSVNLQRLAGLEDSLCIGADLDIDAKASRDFSSYGAEGGLRHLRFLTPVKSLLAKDLNFAFETATDTTTARVSAGDLSLNFGAAGAIDRLAEQLGVVAETITAQMEKKAPDMERLKHLLPVMALRLDAGRDNPLSRILEHMGVTYNSAYLSLGTGPERGLEGCVNVGALANGGLLLDTVGLQLSQDSTGFRLHGDVHNFTKQNPNKFSASLDGFVQTSGIGAHLTFTDAQGKRGIDLGARAELTDEAVSISLFPHHPIIAYRNFTVNEDNYIRLGKDKSVRANVDLLADDGTGLRLYSQPEDSINDVTLSVSNLNLGELSDVLPYLPQMGGMLNGDFHLVDDHTNLSAAALFETEGLELEGVKLGKVGVEAIYLPKEGGEHYANAYISSEGEEVMECEGTYRDDDGGKFEGNVRLHDFPLQMLNGFLAGTDIGLNGKAGGELTIAGALDRIGIDGELRFDSAHIYSDVYGLDFRMDERPIAIRQNRMFFNDFSLYSTRTDNPLVMNGALDFTNFDRIALDFTMKANNFELIDAQRNAQSLVFGKVFANYTGTLRGTLDNMAVRGRLEVLDRTDVTYILKDSPLTVDDRLHDLVRFVSFEDTTSVAEDLQSVATSSFDLTLGISISDAARFHCFLSEDGQNYVDLEGGGDLTMRITQQGDLRMTGRVTVNEGEMKYSLPVIPLKTFSIVQGSYVEFTGDVANPTLSIAAKERVKATVTESDQPRSVAFDVGVAITKPLNDMGLEFTIEAPEDLSVQNQLAAMTAAQRGKTAVAMLATGMYMTDDMTTTGGSGFKASNALNAFLQSEIQHIAGSALKTIDVSIGMESGTSTAGTETTDYSFQFAKRFWGNRISVIIGGKVSTGEDARNSTESFIDNVAVEYRLDKSASRYVQVFYDRSVQDPLEGQLTKTGAGVVLRRKSNRLGDLFIFRNRKNAADRKP